jgi:hypothetical protein
MMMIMMMMMTIMMIIMIMMMIMIIMMMMIVLARFVVSKFSRTMFLKLSSAESHGCQGFRETKMDNGGGILLVVVIFYVRMRVSVATFDADYPVTDRKQTNNHRFRPEAS